MNDDSRAPVRRALIIIPGTVNYFHNLSGRRLAEALATLGFTVEVSTLRECPQGEYDCCFLSSITESLFSSHRRGRRAGADTRSWQSLPGRVQPVAGLRVHALVSPDTRE